MVVLALASNASGKIRLMSSNLGFGAEGRQAGTMQLGYRGIEAYQSQPQNREGNTSLVKAANPPRFSRRDRSYARFTCYL